MRRRTLQCALMLVLLLGMIFCTSLPALAAGEVTVQVKDVSASPGKTVTTELVISGTLAAFQGRLLYDTAALTLQKIEATDAISGSMTLFSQDEITGDFEDAAFASASSSDKEIDGAVLTFTFLAGSQANGSYSFSVEQFMASDAAGEVLTVKAVDTVVDPGTLEEPASKDTASNAASGESSSGGSGESGSDSSDASGAGSDSGDASDSGNPNSESGESGSGSGGAGSDAGGTDSDASGGNWLPILLIAGGVVVVAGIVLIAVRAKKKKKA